MDVANILNEKLLKQPFGEDPNQSISLTEYQHLAYMYSQVENSIAVLSDLKSNKSYIYNGGVAAKLGLSEKNSTEKINSIWEEEIFNKIHPDDLLEKHTLELQLFQLLKTLPISERSNYQITSKIRIRDESGKYVSIQHRMFYICSSANGSMWLALCLYNFSYDKSTPDTADRIIINSATGDVISSDRERCIDILSDREKEVLHLIRKGKMSKEIADSLSISINTVNRHRQNILEKLRVNNSIEACRTAEFMGLF
jgi:DNA-binding CsgD family transcriptional regulator